MILTRIVTRPIKDLVSTVSRIGTGELGVESRSFHSAELDYLAKTINTMSGSLAAADRERKAQMAKAREIQRDLLPSDAETAGLNIAYYFEPADDVGGDYYDVLPLDDGSCLICVADVTGHGIPAAMTAATIKALLMCSAKGRTSPAEIFGFINQSLIKINPSGDFVTMFLVRAFPAEGRIQYASAGHEPAWLRLPDGSLQRLESTGLVLGVMEDADWFNATVDLPKRSRLLVVTDGVAETFSNQGKMFGRERLGELYAKSAACPVREWPLRLGDDVSTFRGELRQQDDITIVLAECV